MFVLLVLLTFVAALTVDYLVQRADARREALALVPATASPARPVPRVAPAPAGGLDELSKLPAGLFLAPGHDWLQLESSGSVRLGTDRLALALLGGVDRLELLPAGSVVHQGDPLATLHFGERSIVLRAPVEGVIDEVNTLVGADPQRLARDPFEEGWLYRLHARGLAKALHGMKVAEEAAAWMGGELARVRDHAAELARGARAAATIRPEGSAIPVGIAGELGERDWKELVDRIYTPAA
jgi:glycine cleavage system H protein